MPHVFIPPTLRSLTGDRKIIDTGGRTVRQVIGELEQRYPGIRKQLCQDDALRPGLSVVVDGSVSSMGMMQRVSDNSEVHFLPAISGG